MSRFIFDLFFDAEIDMNNWQEIKGLCFEIADFILEFRDEDFAYCDLIHASIDHAVSKVED